jgi:hypothetical protein
LNIEDLGNLGDLIAAIATIVTLAYLARQIRLGAKSGQGSTAASLLELEVSTFALIAQHAGVYERGCENLKDLNPEEKIIFEQLVSAVMSLMTSGFFQFQNDLLTDFDPYLLDWEYKFLKKPGFQSMWKEIRHSYPQEFCECLDQVRKPGKGAAQLQV